MTGLVSIADVDKVAFYHLSRFINKYLTVYLQIFNIYVSIDDTYTYMFMYADYIALLAETVNDKTMDFINVNTLHILITCLTHEPVIRDSGYCII